MIRRARKLDSPVFRASFSESTLDSTMSSTFSLLPQTCLLIAVGLGLVAAAGCDTAGQTQADEMDSSASLDTVMVTGAFEGKEGISTSGTYEIGRSGEDLILAFKESFQTESGPDLYVVLSPKGTEEAAGDNVLDGSAKRIRALRALEGKQRYDLKDDLGLASFNSVAIQCVQFSHLYGVAEL